MCFVYALYLKCCVKEPCLHSGILEDKNWTQLNELVGQKITHTHTIDMNLHEHVNQAAEISTAASNEHNIKSSLRKIGHIWNQLNLTVSNYKETEWLILVQSDDIINQIDEHLVTLQAINFSQYKAPFEEEINLYQSGLQLVLTSIEKWLESQSRYLYLAPIFSSKEICHQLPHEGMRFQKISGSWMEALKKAREVGNSFKILQQ